MRMILPLACLAVLGWAVPAAAEPRPDWVRGDIQAIRGRVLTIDGTDVALADDVAVSDGGAPRSASSLAVGQNVTAVMADGSCHKIEVHSGDRKFHGNGPAKPDDSRKRD